MDEDTVPELLIRKDQEYELYFFDGSKVQPISMSDAGIKANTYGSKHGIEDHGEYRTPYWFEYVPQQGLVRIHENFWSRLTELGYDSLIPCAYLYDSIAAAYENREAVSDSKKVLEDFVNGKVDALCYEDILKRGTPTEEGFFLRNYEEIAGSTHSVSVEDRILEYWVGEYEFHESVSEPTLMMMNYRMEIYRDNDTYYADIEIDRRLWRGCGRQPDWRAGRCTL